MEGRGFDSPSRPSFHIGDPDVMIETLCALLPSAMSRCTLVFNSNNINIRRVRVSVSFLYNWWPLCLESIYPTSSTHPLQLLVPAHTPPLSLLWPIFRCQAYSSPYSAAERSQAHIPLSSLLQPIFRCRAYSSPTLLHLLLHLRVM